MILIIKCHYDTPYCFRNACAIDDPDTQTVIITGGSPTTDYFNSSFVHVYGLEGYQRDLEPMNIGRQNHACTSFMSEEKRVRTKGKQFIDGHFIIGHSVKEPPKVYNSV